MRKAYGFVVSGGLLVFVTALQAGCWNVYDDYYLPLTNPALARDGGTDGGDSGPSTSCIPSLNAEAVADSCGVFVSSTGSDTSGKGTQAAPYQTLTAAVGKANGKPVYACAGTTPFSEALAVPAGTTIFGGLDCSSWKYVGATTKTIVTAGAGQVPVTLAAGSGAKLADLHVLAADVSMMSDGTSSIAVVANGATAELDGCVVEAQGGAAGVAGKNFSAAAQAGMTGMPGTDACMNASITDPGASVSSGCGANDSTSGLGGDGSVASGGSGSPGSPAGAMNGGAGDTGSGCTPGKTGDPGTPGTPGIGAAGLGAFSSGTYTGAVGTDGNPGAPGQGGGGGGGAKGGTGAGMCPAGMAAGASGGSGGSGGCGGAGGQGGGAGGASIALVNLGATLTMSGVTLKAGGGGAGGNGGAGQNGGNGGNPGAGGKVLTATSLNPGCGGGPGGVGGNGGQGGGGRGGHAIGIAYTGPTAPSMTGVTFVMGTAGSGGKGDDSMGNMGDGAQGVVADVQGF